MAYTQSRVLLVSWLNIDYTRGYTDIFYGIECGRWHVDTGRKENLVFKFNILKYTHTHTQTHTHTHTYIYIYNVLQFINRICNTL